jgi:hypothetical protein
MTLGDGPPATWDWFLQGQDGSIGAKGMVEVPGSLAAALEAVLRPNAQNSLYFRIGRPRTASAATIANLAQQHGATDLHTVACAAAATTGHLVLVK